MTGTQLTPGQLPPGAQEQLDRRLVSLRRDIAAGVFDRVEILPGPGCGPAEALQGQSWTVDEVPALPIVGCTRAPCCGCDYGAVLPETEPATDQEIAALHAEIERMLAQLPGDLRR